MNDCPYCGEMPDVDPDRGTFACGTPRDHPQWGLRSFRCFRSQIDALVRQHDKLVAERDKLALANLMQRHGWTVLVNALKDGKSYSVIAAECRNDKDIGCYCGCHISTVMAEEKPLRSNLPPQHSEI